MVSPRRRSSSHRSGSMPVSARTSVDLPWSTWPAVAMTSIPDGPGAVTSTGGPPPARRRPASRRPTAAGCVFVAAAQEVAEAAREEQVLRLQVLGRDPGGGVGFGSAAGQPLEVQPLGLAEALEDRLVA